MSPNAPARPDLRLVAESEVYDLMKPTATTAERVKRLQAEARALALEEVELLDRLLVQAADKAREIAEGGEAYPVGARELASRLAADLPMKAGTIKAIVARSH
jgi:hypothetical protein